MLFQNFRLDPLDREIHIKKYIRDLAKNRGGGHTTPVPGTATRARRRASGAKHPYLLKAQKTLIRAPGAGRESATFGADHGADIIL